jgi:hypothetical protein
MLLQGQKGTEPVYWANTIAIEDMQVFVGHATLDLPDDVFLPVAVR